MAKKSKLEVVDTRGLTDADWAAIDKVIRAYRAGGMEGFWDELETFGDGNLILQITIVGAFFPDVIREAIKDEMAEQSITLEDLRNLVKRLH